MTTKRFPKVPLPVRQQTTDERYPGPDAVIYCVVVDPTTGKLVKAYK